MWLSLLLGMGCGFSAPATPTGVTKAYISGLSWSPQTRNNCGPQALSSILNYWGHQVGQAEISRSLKDCSTCYMRSDVIDPYVQQFGLRAQRFKNGNRLHVRQLVANGLPVLVLQYLNKPGHIPHFRIVTGYDDKQSIFYINDPYYSPTASISYQNFDRLWGTLYGREFITIYPAHWKDFVLQVLKVSPSNQTRGRK